MANTQGGPNENLSDMAFPPDFLSSDMDLADSAMDPFHSAPLYHMEPKREWTNQDPPSSPTPPPPPPPPDHLFQSIPSPATSLKSATGMDSESALPHAYRVHDQGVPSLGHPSQPPSHPHHPHFDSGHGATGGEDRNVGVRAEAGVGNGGYSKGWASYGAQPPVPGLETSAAPLGSQGGAVDKYPPMAVQSSSPRKPVPAQTFSEYDRSSRPSSAEWPTQQFWSMVGQPQPGPSTYQPHFGGLPYGAVGGREDEWQKEQSDKRRLDRNSREQKRSKRISDQIKELKGLLEAAGVNMVKGNKSSILTCAAEYIMDLQRRNEAAVCRARQPTPALSTSTATSTNGEVSSWPSSSSFSGRAAGEDGAAGRAINYRRVFHDQSVPVALTAVDGRFIDCNWRFERECGYSKEQLRDMTFFSLVAANGEHGSVFQTVAQMLKDTSRRPKEFVVKALLKGGEGGKLGEKVLQLSTVFADDPEDHEVKYFCCAFLSAGGVQAEVQQPEPQSTAGFPGRQHDKKADGGEGSEVEGT